MKKKRVLSVKNHHFCKQIKNRVYYFGKDEGTEASYKKALARYKEEEPFLKLGLEPEKAAIGHQLKDLLNHFLSKQKQKVEVGEIKQVTLRDLTKVCDRLVEVIPKSKLLLTLGNSDFERVRNHFYKNQKGEQRSPKSADRDLGYVRQILNFAYDSEMIEKPLRFKEALKAVPKKMLRKRRSEVFNSTPKIFKVEEIKLIIKEAPPQLKAASLLGINCGYNPSDIGHMKLDQVDKIGDTLSYPRVKTGIDRLSPLWPETQAALRAWKELRPNVEHDYLFLKEDVLKPLFDGQGVVRLGDRFKNFLNKIKIYKAGKTFSALRTTFATWGDELNDEAALKSLMGHSETSMLRSNYVFGMFLPRLLKITDHIREKVFG